MSSFMKMPRILGTLIIAALVVPAIGSIMLVQNAYASPDQAPVLNPIGDNQTNEGQLLEFTITATDPDSDNLTYSAPNLPDGATFDALADPPIFSWTPGYDQTGDHEVQFEVSDGYLSDSENITITVGNVNRAPVLNPIGDNQTNEGQLLEFTITATDPDSDNLTYSAPNLPDGATFDALADPPIFSWTPGYDQTGDHEVQFEVSDGYLSDSENITITVGNVNRAPVLNPIGDNQTNEGQLLEFTITATDPDSDNLTYSAPNLPDGATFDALADPPIFSWTPGYDQTGDHEVQFEVTDGYLSDSENITITVGNVNRAPVLNPIGDNQTNEGQLLEFTITATDPDSDNLTYSAPNLPDGATFDALADPPIFSWTPGYDQTGDHEVQFEVSDGYLSDSENITITVGNVNRAPVLNPIGDNQTNEGQLLQFTITATDPDGDTLTYLAPIASNLPAGATFNGSTSTFSWTPTYDQAGTYPVHFEVTDGNLSDSENITITVINVNRAPVIGSVTADPDRLWPPNHKDVDVTIIMDVTDPDGYGDIESATYTYSVTDEYGIYDVAETDLPEDSVISLVAERYGEDRDGRVYTITVTAYDTGELSNSASVEIIVPHDQGEKSRTATAYRAGEPSDGGSDDVVVVPPGQSKKGKPETTYDAGEASDGDNANVVVPPGQSKKGKPETTYDAGEASDGGSVDVVVPDDKSKKDKKAKSGK